jgi:hypothetical protein
MTAPPIGLRLNEGRPLPGARPHGRLLDRGIDRQSIHPIHGHPRHAVGARAIRDVRHARRALLASEDGVAVILADEDDGKIPDGREVQRLVERPLVAGTVPEKRHRHAAVPQYASRKTAARAHGDRRADDREGAQHRPLEVADVHRPTLAAAAAGFLPAELGHRRSEVVAPGNGRPVAPMRRGEVIVLVERGERAGCHRLLTGIEMAVPRELPGLKHLTDRLLEGADLHHGPIYLDERLSVNRRCLSHYRLLDCKNTGRKIFEPGI